MGQSPNSVRTFGTDAHESANFSWDSHCFRLPFISMTVSRSRETRSHRPLPLRSRFALLAGNAAAGASRLLGRGSGGFIGGAIAARISPSILSDLARGKQCVIVTGTNGKSTTTRMVRTALAAMIPPVAGANGRMSPEEFLAQQMQTVASNTRGDNLTSGVTAALMAFPRAHSAALEVDEMHVLEVADAINPAAFVLLNLSRDQLDRVGEIGTVEARLREAVHRHPQAIVVANCDDPLITSIALDAPRVVWVSTGNRWRGDAIAFPRGGRVERTEDGWQVVDEDGAVLLTRPTPQWSVADVDEGSGASGTICGPFGVELRVDLPLPGAINVGNAAQAIAVGVALGVHPEDAASAVCTVSEVSGRYAMTEVDGRILRTILAKNPAGWHESLAMVDPEAHTVVLGVNAQVGDGLDPSWLWDIPFDMLRPDQQVIACGERRWDVAVRLRYAGIDCRVVDLPMDAVRASKPGRIDMLLNYTSLHDFKKVLEAEGVGK